MFTSGEGGRLTTKNTNTGFRELRPLLIPQASDRACFVVTWEDYAARDRFNVLSLLAKSKRIIAKDVRYGQEIESVDLPPRDNAGQVRWARRFLSFGDFKVETGDTTIVFYPFGPDFAAEAQEVMLRKLANLIEWPKRFPDGRINSTKFFKAETFHFITTQRLKGF